MGKGEIARYEQFLLIPQYFQKACFPEVSKCVIVWKWVNPFPKKPWFLHVCSTSLLKTLWEKEKLLISSNFSFSHSVFYPFGELSAIFIKCRIVVCKLFQFGKSLKFVACMRVKSHSMTFPVCFFLQITFNLGCSKILQFPEK